LKELTPVGEYEETGMQLEGDAWLCDRTTMQRHFADPSPYVRTSDAPPGSQPVHVARRGKSYAVSVDTTGKLRWSTPDIHGDYLICVVDVPITRW
jgi:hypothetical protein